ncbi:N-acetyltransferase 8-like [Phascolarctos cinereus]|uniref:N-acetyltransferase 8-like n=1 Tax=Phascolarctos cinereus TaxID=38626 RepID=A0A6P5LG04_PHACI|nr:N-acetyltransferase 8-like [Phascolarctos cinereus]XP_020856798.1 N-acetyltransferase 8-like [Phascolarctos cinereus]
MASYHIRRYHDQDWEPVRELFSEGLLGNMPSEFWHLLKKPRIFLVLLGVPFALVLGSGSLVLCLLSLLGLLAGQWLSFRHCVIRYVDNSLHADLLDIQKSYLSGTGSSFWVAESEHQVVGIVGAHRAKRPIGRGNYLELQRLSVKSTYRGKGLARTLVQTVLQLARDQGYDGVVLETTNSNYPARRLYESLGFWKSHESGYYLNWWQGFLSLWCYQYDFSSQA